MSEEEFLINLIEETKKEIRDKKRSLEFWENQLKRLKIKDGDENEVKE